MERNELVLKVYAARNYLTARSFIRELNYRENKPKFVVADRCCWGLTRVMKKMKEEHDRVGVRFQVDETGCLFCFLGFQI
ncbi:MAG: hypothetical protein ABWW66_06175 [Archaeoglobaceae archaeon]